MFNVKLIQDNIKVCFLEANLRARDDCLRSRINLLEAISKIVSQQNNDTSQMNKA